MAHQKNLARRRNRKQASSVAAKKIAVVAKKKVETGVARFHKLRTAAKLRPISAGAAASAISRRYAALEAAGMLPA